MRGKLHRQSITFANGVGMRTRDQWELGSVWGSAAFSMLRWIFFPILIFFLRPYTQRLRYYLNFLSAGLLRFPCGEKRKSISERETEWMDLLTFGRELHLKIEY